MESLLTNLKCSFCSKEYSVQLPLNARINIDCDCGAWGYVSENYEESLYVLDLQKRFGDYLATQPISLLNYAMDFVDLREYFSTVSSSGIREGNAIYYKWIKKRE